MKFKIILLTILITISIPAMAEKTLGAWFAGSYSMIDYGGQDGDGFALDFGYKFSLLGAELRYAKHSIDFTSFGTTFSIDDEWFEAGGRLFWSFFNLRAGYGRVAVVNSCCDAEWGAYAGIGLMIPLTKIDLFVEYTAHFYTKTVSTINAGIRVYF